MNEDQAHDFEDFEASYQGRRKRLLISAALVSIVAIAGIGALTTFLGIGPFGYRLFRYGMVKVFVYNGTPHFAEIEVEGSRYEIKPYEGEILELVGGELKLSTTLNLVAENPTTKKAERTEQREFLEDQSFLASGSNYLYHVALPDSTCLAIADMSSYYDGSGGGVPELVGTVFKDARLQELSVENIYFPQGTLPDKASPPVYWLAVVNCDVLREPKKALVNLRIQAEERRKQLQERRQIYNQGQ